MTIRTYTVYGKGSVGPAHPNFNPAVDVTLSDDGRVVERSSKPTGRLGHRWAMEKGYSLDESQAYQAERQWYKDLETDIRYAEAGL